MSKSLNTYKTYSKQIKHNFKKNQIKRLMNVKNTHKNLFVQNQIIAYIHSKGMNCSEKVMKSEKINQELKQFLDKAIKRAKGNFRKTVMERDL